MWTDKRMDRRRDKTKLITAFRNVANTPKNGVGCFIVFSHNVVSQNKTAA